MKLYEGLFLIEAGRVAQDWEGAEGGIVSILEKHGATVKQANRYDERKLAYPVKKVRRGAYLLVYFESDPLKIVDMREDLALSEDCLRHLFIRVDGDVVPEAPMLGNAEPGLALEGAEEDAVEADADEEEGDDEEEEEK